jgi:nucleotide-binding universal stress UspA family protein
LAAGAVLSAQLAVPLIVVHSADPDLFLTGEPRQLALERGHAFLDALTDGYTLDERVVDVDDPARLVIAIAEAGASMIVIGTRGRTGLRAAVMGSLSQTVIGSAACPVLVIPSTAARSVHDVSDDSTDPLPASAIADQAFRTPTG